MLFSDSPTSDPVDWKSSTPLPPRLSIPSTRPVSFSNTSPRIWHWLKVEDWLADLIFGAIESPTIVILAIIGVLIVLGLFMNPTPGLLLCVPLFLPVAQKMQFDLVQFGVMIVLALAIGLLTPPVGLVLYIVANVAKVEVGDIIKELLPFIIALLLVVLLIAFIPGFTLYMTNLFYGK